jgi:hypothetical protein
MQVANEKEEICRDGFYVSESRIGLKYDIANVCRRISW